MKLTRRGGRGAYEHWKAVVPPRSGAAPGSPSPRSPVPVPQELGRGHPRGLSLTSRAAPMPVAFLVRRASTPGPWVRLGRGALSAHYLATTADPPTPAAGPVGAADARADPPAARPTRSAPILEPAMTARQARSPAPRPRTPGPARPASPLVALRREAEACARVAGM